MKVNKNFLIIGLMIGSILLRLMNFIPNFAPAVGVTLFGAALLKRKELALILPLIMIYFSDFIINNTFARSFFPNTDGIVWFSDYMIWNTIAYVGIAFLGMYGLKNHNFKKSMVMTLLASVFFFIVTNFGSWLSPLGLYAQEGTGLLTAYVAAIPFFRTSLLSDLLFSGVLFGIYYFIKEKYGFRSAVVDSRIA